MELAEFIGKRLLAKVLILILSFVPNTAVIDKNLAIKQTELSPKDAKWSIVSEPIDKVDQIYLSKDGKNLVFWDEGEGLIKQSSNGGSSWQITLDKAKMFNSFIQHPFAENRMYLVSSNKTHLKSTDFGKSWRKFKTKHPLKIETGTVISFKASNQDDMIVQTEICELSWFTKLCRTNAFYTTDNFETLSLLRENIEKCSFAHSGNMQTDEKDTIICLEADSKYGSYPNNLKIVSSKDYFKNHQESLARNDKSILGVLEVHFMSKFILALVRSESESNLLFYVSKDGFEWEPTRLPMNVQIKKGYYSLREPSKHSIQIDVEQNFGTFDPIGVLLSSDIDGKVFTESLPNTNRVPNQVEFIRLKKIEGIALANVVQNWKEIKDSWGFKKKIIQTRISFDDGHTWEPIQENFKENSSVQKAGTDKYDDSGDENKADEDDNESNDNNDNDDEEKGDEDDDPDKVDKSIPGSNFVHLGFSNSFAAGIKNFGNIIIGIGSVGNSLASEKDRNVIISSDAGQSWIISREGPHLLAIGDRGGIIFAVSTEKTSQVYYSLDYGVKWIAIDLQEAIEALSVYSVEDKKRIYLISHNWSTEENALYMFDFENLGLKKCLNQDLEEKKIGNNRCMMGMNQFIRRKKQGKDCFLDDKEIYPVENFKICDCTDQDYECDEYFYKNKDGSCVVSDDYFDPPEFCKNKGDRYMGSSGYRLIAGNICKVKNSSSKDKPVERICNENPFQEMVFGQNIKEFKSKISKKLYSESAGVSSRGNLAIIELLKDGNVYKTDDIGMSWTTILPKVKIADVVQHPQFLDWFYFLPEKGKIGYLSSDRGNSILKFNLPSKASSAKKKQLIPNYEDPSLLILNYFNCDAYDECPGEAYYTEDSGRSWNLLLEDVSQCQFVLSSKIKSRKTLVICSIYKEDQNYKSLVASLKWFKDKGRLIFDKIVGYLITDEFLIVATVSDDFKFLEMAVSVNGEQFTKNKYPKSHSVEEQRSYTVLDSSTASIFIHKAGKNNFQGSVLKSNSNGTYYVNLIDKVNRERNGFVDFERIKSTEGTIIVNVVANADSVQTGKDKKLQTMISFSDGSNWSRLKTKSGNSLNLFGPTHLWFRELSISWPMNSGFLIATGNEGEYLEEYQKASTYISKDGGVSWEMLKTGAWLSAIGDQGSLLVLVQDGSVQVKTNTVSYSIDQGKTWKEYQFSMEHFFIFSISSTPLGKSRRFLLDALHYKEASLEDEEGNPQYFQITVNLEGSSTRRCSEPSDFAEYKPQFPDLQRGSCLFGHEITYQRKSQKSNCFIGYQELKSRESIRDCACTRDDYECDYNFERQIDGTCKLVESLKPLDPKMQCQQPGVTEYFKPSGYKRHPLSTCEGGLILNNRNPIPCGERKRLAAKSIFLIVFLPVILSLLVAYILVTKIRDKGYGEIYLGDPEYSHPIPRLISHGVNNTLPVLQAFGATGLAIYSFIASKFSEINRSRQPAYTRFNAPMNIDDAEAIDEDIFNYDEDNN